MGSADEVDRRSDADGAPLIDAFISYAREQKEFVAELAAALEAHGKHLWIDWKDIPPTADWRANVRAGIEMSTSFVAVLSPDSLRSEICEEERLHAIGCNKRLIPILREDVDGSRLAAEFNVPNWIFIRSDDDFQTATRTLVAALDTDLEWAADHARLLVRAVEWKAKGCDRSLLLRGRDLAAAERWLDAQSGRETKATALHLEYIDASRRQTRLRKRISLGVGTVVAAVVLTLGVVGWRQNETARSRSLAAQAIAVLPTDPWAGLALAAEAAEARETAESTRALRLALGAPRERLIVREPGNAVQSARFSEDSTAVISVSYDGTVRRTRIEDGASEVESSGDQAHAGSGRATSPDGAFEVLALGGGVVRGGDDEALRRAVPGGGVVRLVDARSPLPPVDRPPLFERTNLGEGIPGLMPGVQFSPDGRHFLAFGFDDTARVWSLKTLRLGEDGMVAVAMSPDGERCATVDELWNASVWSCSSGSLLRRWNVHPSTPLDRGPNHGDFNISFSRDGSQLFMSTGFPTHSTNSWDPESGELLRPLPDSSDVDRGGSSAFLNISRTEARVVDLGSGRETSLQGAFDRGLGRGVFSDDGTRLITVNRGLESVVRIWDLPSGQLRRTIGPFEHPVEGVDINPDGSLVLVASGVDPSLWDVDSGDVVAELHGHSEFVYGASFSADGRFVATAGGDGSARVWDTLTGVEIGAQSADGDAVLDVALGSGGELLTLGVDGAARVFVCDACRISNELSDLAAELLSARPR